MVPVGHSDTPLPPAFSSGTISLLDLDLDLDVNTYCILSSPSELLHRDPRTRALRPRVRIYQLFGYTHQRRQRYPLAVFKARRAGTALHVWAR